MSSVGNISVERLAEMRQRYYEIRRQVFNDATRPVNGDFVRHEENKRKFRSKVTEACDAADLALYRVGTEEVRTKLWNHLWTKVKYAGIKAQNATTEINSIKGIFDNYRRFADRGWDVKIGWNEAARRHVLLTGGSQVHAFLTRTGDFNGLVTNGKLTKLDMIVKVARSYIAFCDSNANGSPLEFVTNGRQLEDVWGIHAALMVSGYRSDLTCCHFMMDVGFPLIKPDVVLSRLFLEWGWLHDAVSDLPKDAKPGDLVGSGRYGSRYVYTKPEMYRPIIDLARLIVAGLNDVELKIGVGWTTGNALREFDLFLVKAGQQPEAEFGIERTLFPSGRDVSKKRHIVDSAC